MIWFSLQNSLALLSLVLLTFLFPFICADVSTTMILTPGPVIDFLITNQDVREARYIDWVKVKKKTPKSYTKGSDFSINFSLLNFNFMVTYRPRKC